MLTLETVIFIIIAHLCNEELEITLVVVRVCISNQRCRSRIELTEIKKKNDEKK